MAASVSVVKNLFRRADPMAVMAARVAILFCSAIVMKGIYKPTAGNHTAPPKMVFPAWVASVLDPMVLI